MSIKKLVLLVKPEQRGLRLDQVLASWLPGALLRPVSKAMGRKLLLAGAVYLNGRRVRIASKSVLPGARVEVFVDLEKLFRTDATDERFEMDPSRILYEDEDLVVVDKPPGLPTQPTLDEARDNLFAALKRYLGSRGDRAVPYVGLHHRLDRDTSGAVLFTKSRRANAGVAEAFASHRVSKLYLALAELPAGSGVPEAWSVKNHLGRAKGAGKKARFTAVQSGGDFAQTDFRVLSRLHGAFLVEARPKTGRTHQIRAHLSEAGFPIVGDTFYGAKPGGARRVMLHAASLTFPHPVHQTEVSVQSPMPEDFSRCLQTFQAQKS